MRRTSSRALQGLILAAGTPLGWLLIRSIQGSAVQRELTANPGLYLYMSIGTAVVFSLFGFLLGTREARLLEANQRLEALTVTDSLTGLRNTRYFHTRLAEEHADAERTGKPLAVVVVDLDHFKRVNDQYGHLIGDDVLVNAARAIASITREGETEARIGGEEFGMLLPDSSGAAGRDVAERVRRAIEETKTQLPGGTREPIRITASAGVASTAEFPGASAQELLGAADEAMYRAKQAGRNRTVVAAS